MSASREKKTRQPVSQQGPTAQTQKKQKAAKEAHRSNVRYTVVGILCAALVAFLIVWNTGVIQRSATAVTVNGVSYTAADVQYYVRNVLYQNGLTSTSATTLKSTVIDSETGETLYDAIVDQAVEQLSFYAAMEDQAIVDGFAMSDDTQEYLSEQLDQLELQWLSSGYKDRASYIRAIYGPYMTYNRLLTLYTRTLLVNDYCTAYADSLTYSDSDYEGYYADHADELDDFTITQFVLLARPDTTDEQGNTIEMTDEETEAALAEAQAETKALAEEIQAKLDAGEDPSTLAETYADQLYSSNVSQVRVGANVNTSYSDWAYDSARQVGDTTIAEYSSGTSTFYYVVRFEGRERDDSKTANVRHILVAAETDDGASQPTEEQYAAAYAEAEELLAQWKAGDATEDSFALLAEENSADTSSASNGGLISDISSTSSYVTTFLDWALDPSRQPGDTGLVQNTGSSTKGWHIMYYVSDGAPEWKLTAESALSSQDVTAWEDAATDGYDAVYGLGMKFVQL